MPYNLYAKVYYLGKSCQDKISLVRYNKSHEQRAQCNAPVCQKPNPHWFSNSTFFVIKRLSISMTLAMSPLTLKVAWVVGLMSSKMTWFWRCHSSSFSLAWVAALALASALQIQIHRYLTKIALFLDKRVGWGTHKILKQDKNPFSAQLVNKSHTKDYATY